MSVIETQSLSKTYGSVFGKPLAALNGVSLSVEQGTIFGLIGANGAGKTTLVKILLGLARATSGRASLLGGHPGDARIRRRVGYLPEAMRVPDHMKAAPFLRYMGRLNGVDSASLDRRVPQLLEQVGLGGVKKFVKDFSKGMQQRLGLAQALINDPEMLFLDEPTDGLDPVGRKEVRDLLTRLRAEGRTIFLNSHLLSEIEMVCDRIVILHKGEVARAGSPAEFTRGGGFTAIRVAAASGTVQSAAAMVDAAVTWQGTTLRFSPRDRTHLNQMLDRLRSVPVEIEAVEPAKQSLEDFFLEVVTTS